MISIRGRLLFRQSHLLYRFLRLSAIYCNGCRYTLQHQAVTAYQTLLFLWGSPRASPLGVAVRLSICLSVRNSRTGL